MLVPPSRNNANAPSGSAIMAGMWCLTANDSGSASLPSVVPPLKNYRPITACFEGLPGRIIPVDLAPVTVTAPLADATGDLVEAPCGLPPGKPELFNVRNTNSTADLGPICVSYPCALEIRGRNFFSTPMPATGYVSLVPPDEQATGPHSSKTPPMIIVMAPAHMPNYDSVSMTFAGAIIGKEIAVLSTNFFLLDSICR